MAAGSYWLSAFGQTTGEVAYDMGVSVAVNYFQMGVTSASRAFDPKDFWLDYWDGFAWLTHTQFTNVSFTQGVLQTFDVDDDTFATKWRIRVTQNNGSPDYVQIAEIIFFGHEQERSRITYTAGTYVAVPSYDLVLHIANAPSIGEQVRYPGYYEVTVNDSPPSEVQPIHQDLIDVFGTIQDNQSWFARLYRQTQEGIRSAAATARTETTSP